jgi:hypothetical protein
LFVWADGLLVALSISMWRVKRVRLCNDKDESIKKTKVFERARIDERSVYT